MVSEEKRLRRIEKIRHKHMKDVKAAKEQFFTGIGKMWFMFRHEEGKLYQMLRNKTDEIEKDIQKEIKEKGLEKT